MGAQSAALFAVWLAYGVWAARQIPARSRPLRSLPVRGRWFYGLAWLIGGAAASLGLLALAAAAGFDPGGALRPSGLAAAALAGLVFVHSQASAAAFAVSAAMQRRNPRAPEASESEGPR